MCTLLVRSSLIVCSFVVRSRPEQRPQPRASAARAPSFPPRDRCTRTGTHATHTHTAVCFVSAAVVDGRHPSTNGLPPHIACAARLLAALLNSTRCAPLKRRDGVAGAPVRQLRRGAPGGRSGGDACWACRGGGEPSTAHENDQVAQRVRRELPTRMWGVVVGRK